MVIDLEQRGEVEWEGVGEEVGNEVGNWIRI